MEIKLKIPDQKLPKFPDYEKKFSRLEKLFSERKNDSGVLSELKQIKKLLGKKESVDLKPLESYLSRLDKVMSRMPKGQTAEKSDGELVKVLKETSKKLSALAGAKSENYSELSGAVDKLSKKLSRLSIKPVINVEQRDKYMPYVT